MIGRTISHYLIEEKLGEGGMGVVFRARDLNLNRPVAIKFLSASSPTDEARRRFQQETQTASSLNHPHIAAVYDAGSHDGRAYLVSEYVEGATLREWLRRDRPSYRQIVEILLGIADALACAHSVGIVHRDIKPENILVSHQGYAKLLDFGVAKLFESGSAKHETNQTSTALTHMGVLIGTVPYMAPEAIQSRDVDARSDVFSFGVVLYEALAGQRPFQGRSDADVLRALVSGPPRPLLELRPDVPRALEPIVDKALEKDPSDRYQSMREIVVDLRRALRQEHAPAPGAAKVPSRNRRRWAALALVILGAAAAAWALKAWSWLPSAAWQHPLTEATFTRVTDFQGIEVDAAISPDGQFVAFLSDRSGPVDVWVTQVGSGAFVNLTNGAFPELLHEEMQSVGFTGDATHVWFRVSEGNATWIVPALGGAARPLLEPGIHPVWSSDGQRLVYSVPEPLRGEPLVVSDANGGNPREFYKGPSGSHSHFLAWAKDDRSVFFTNPLPPNDIWRVALSGGEAARITRHQTRVTHATPLDTNTLLYVAASEDGSGSWLYGMDLRDRIPHRLSIGVEQYLSIAADSRGRRLAATVANPSGSLWTVPIQSGQATESDVRRFQVPTVRAMSPRITGGDLFFLAARGGAPGLWRLRDGQAVELWRGTEGYVPDAPAISGDGQTLAVPIRREGRTTLHLMTRDGTNVRAFARSIDVRGGASWSPDGEWIAVGGDAGQGVKLFKVPVDGGQPIVLVDAVSYNPAWAPDGTVIVYEYGASGTGRNVRAVTSDGAPVDVARGNPIVTRRGGDRLRFLGRDPEAVILLGQYRRQNFWLWNVATGTRRQLTDLAPGYSIRGFDVSADGKSIVFDRFRENSDIVLIERASNR